MPVRQIPKSYRNVTGELPSLKNDSSSAFESLLERDFLLLQEFDPHVSTYEVQPVRIEWVDANNKSRHYTPDVLVRYSELAPEPLTCLTLLCEIKTADDLRENAEKYAEKFKVADEYAKEQGWHFRIFTETEIRTPYLENVKFLIRFQNTTVSKEEESLLVETLSELRESSPKELLAACFSSKENQGMLIPKLWKMILVHKIGMDLTLPLSMKSRIWVAEPDYKPTLMDLVTPRFINGKGKSKN